MHCKVFELGVFPPDAYCLKTSSLQSMWKCKLWIVNKITQDSFFLFFSNIAIAYIGKSNQVKEKGEKGEKTYINLAC